jgi:hypothetical protein
MHNASFMAANAPRHRARNGLSVRRTNGLNHRSILDSVELPLCPLSHKFGERMLSVGRRGCITDESVRHRRGL